MVVQAKIRRVMDVIMLHMIGEKWFEYIKWVSLIFVDSWGKQMIL